MQFKRQQQAQVDVNLTPLIDVVFLLLIFFMVSTSFIKETHLTLKLPKAANSEERVVDVEPLEVLVDRNGFYSVDGRALADIDVAVVESALRNLSEGDFSRPLTITADADAPYQAVVTLIDTAGAMGFAQIHITTQPDSSE